MFQFRTTHKCVTGKTRNFCEIDKLFKLCDYSVISKRSPHGIDIGLYYIMI